MLSQRYFNNPMSRLFCAVACAGFINACSNNDDDLGAVGEPDAAIFTADSLLSIQVIGANAEPQDNALVEIIEDSSGITSADARALDTGENNAGIATFVLSSFQGESQVQVRVSKAGFMANNVPVFVPGNQDVIETVVITADLTDDVPGIGIANDDADITQAALSATATGMADNVENPNPASTSVTIPQNSIGMTADGTPLSSNLTMNVVHYDADQGASLDAFPGGFAASINNPQDLINSGLSSTDEGNAVDDDGLVFESVGFVAIEVRDDQNRIASTFDQPIEIATEVKPGTPHPTANPTRSIQGGDQIPIWSFNETSGQWSFEQTGVVQQEADGRLMVRFSTDHLSYYNLDFYGGNRCTITINLDRVDGNGIVPPLNGRLRATGYSRFVSLRPGFNGFARAPANRTLTLTGLTTLAGDPVTVTPSSFSCGGAGATTVNMSVSIPFESPSFAVSGSAETVCSNASTAQPVPVANAYIQVYNYNRATRSLIYVWGRTGSDGTTDFRGETLPAGSYQVYSGAVLRDGRWVSSSSNVTISEGNTVLEPIVFRQQCVITTGGTGGGG